MKILPLSYVAVVMATILALVSGLLHAQSVGDATLHAQDAADAALLLTLQVDDKDLNACQQECRSRFGYDVYANPQWRRGPSRDGSYYAYANCIADCNRRFWKAFDKEMEDLERER